MTAAGARAFLAVGFRSPMQELLSLSEYDLETRRHLSGLASPEEAELEHLHVGRDATAPDSAPGAEHGPTALDTADSTHSDEPHLATLRASLEEMGLLDVPPDRRLLSHESSPERLAIINLVEQLADKHPEAFDARARELAYLASVLIAGVAVEDRVLTPEEARAAALATCNLGLELAQTRGERARIEAEPGLVRLFLVGWRALSEVPGRVVQALTEALDALRSQTSAPLHAWLVEQAEMSVTDLSEAVAKRELAAARDAALVLAFVFDPKVCRALAPLLDELPRFPSGARKEGQWIDSLKSLEAIGELLDELSAA